MIHQPIRTGSIVALLFILFVCLVVPFIAGAIWIKVFTSAAIFALAARGISLVYARLGIVNLAQVALVGVGGWVMLRLNYATTFPFELLLVFSAAITGIVGAILSLSALRMRGLYLALVTLMAAGAAQILFTAFQFPNGGGGFWGVALQSAEEMRRPIFANSDAAFLRYACIVAGLGMWLAFIHERGKPGRAWALIRRSEAAAMAAGVNVALFKMWAFALAGTLAGLAGGLLAGALQLLDAKTFAASESILLFALAVVGGVGHWIGAVIAGLLYRALPALLNDIGLDQDLALIIFGAALLHTIMSAPSGIFGQLSGLMKSRRKTL